MPMKITLDDLTRAEACRDQVEKFQRRFGQSVLVTRQRCLHYAEVFDFYVAGEMFLDHGRFIRFECDAGAAFDRLESEIGEIESRRCLGEMKDAQYDRAIGRCNRAATRAIALAFWKHSRGLKRPARPR